MMRYILIITVLFLSACADYKTGRDAFRAKDYDVAKENLEPLALKLNHSESQVELADLYFRTEPAETHGAIVRDLLANAAPVEEGKAYYLQGRIYEEGYGVPVDGARAIDFYTKANETGYWRAQYEMARLFDRGELVPKDYNRAERLYKTVINQHGYDRAKDNLLRLRADRAIEHKNVPVAEQYLKELVKTDDSKAKRQLAELYLENIKDGSKDAEIIFLYTQMAQEDESGKGWFNLGRIYEEGELATIKPNGLKAYENYKKATELGYWRANYFIGRMYDRGTLLVQNRDWAKKYYEVTLHYNEYEPARNALVKIEEKIRRDAEINAKS